MSRTLYITDLDGTFLNTDSQVSARSADIISDLSRRGALVTVATARTPATVVPLLRDTHIGVPAIVMTGAARYHLGRYSHCRFVDRADVRAVLALCDECGVSPLVYTLPDDGSEVLQVYHAAATPTPHEEAFIALRNRLPLKRFNLATPLPTEMDHRVLLLFALGPESAIDSLAECVRDLTDCTVSCYADHGYPGMKLLEIFAPGVSKARAIVDLAAELGADRTVVYGDNLNDISMMQVADLAVAVEGAFPEARRTADIIIGSNDEDAVARHILADFENSPND